eukprot:7211161-Prymnesium_polylepis.2
MAEGWVLDWFDERRGNIVVFIKWPRFPDLRAWRPRSGLSPPLATLLPPLRSSAALTCAAWPHTAPLRHRCSSLDL